MLIRSGATWCTFFVVVYLGHMCQCGLDAVLWLHRGMLMRFLPAEPCSITRSLSAPVERSCWSCIRWCGTGGFQDQVQCFFIVLSCSIPFCLLLFFSFSSFCLYDSIVGLWSLYWWGVDRSLSALHCRPLLIIIVVKFLYLNHFFSDEGLQLWKSRKGMFSCNICNVKNLAIICNVNNMLKINFSLWVYFIHAVVTQNLLMSKFLIRS